MKENQRSFNIRPGAESVNIRIRPQFKEHIKITRVAIWLNPGSRQIVDVYGDRIKSYISHGVFDIKLFVKGSNQVTIKAITTNDVLLSWLCTE